MDYLQRIFNFVSRILDVISSLFQWLQDAYDWFVEFIIGFPDFFMKWIVDGAIDFFNWLPVPSFFQQAAGALQGIPREVIYFIEPFRVGEGLAIVMIAFLLRFIIRRIPIIG